jgi:hypothetical protein
MPGIISSNAIETANQMMLTKNKELDALWTPPDMGSFSKTNLMEIANM